MAISKLTRYAAMQAGDQEAAKTLNFWQSKSRGEVDKHQLCKRRTVNGLENCMPMHLSSK